MYTGQELGFSGINKNLGTGTSQRLWMFWNLMGRGVEYECSLLQTLAGCDVWICLHVSRSVFLYAKEAEGRTGMGKSLQIIVILVEWKTLLLFKF